MRQIVRDFAEEDRKVDQPVTVLLTRPEYEAFAGLADSNARSLSNQGRHAIKEQLERENGKESK